jgi:RNA methyltransferase, TrmH family
LIVSGVSGAGGVEIIRSRDNKLFKRIMRLVTSSRDRKVMGESILDGAHLVEAFLQSGREALEVIVSTTARSTGDWTRIEKMVGTTRVWALGAELMEAASQLESPASMMAIVQTPVGTSVPADADAVLVLDNVQDPGNVGALLRCAAAFGVKHVLLGEGTAFAWSPKVLRAGQGAHFSLNIVEGVKVLDWLPSFAGRSMALVALRADAVALQDAKLTEPVALLIGNEGQGLAPEVVAACSQRVHVPMSAATESLNAASCGAIALYELSRQRGGDARVKGGGNARVKGGGDTRVKGGGDARVKGGSDARVRGGKR